MKFYWFEFEGFRIYIKFSAHLPNYSIQVRGKQIVECYNRFCNKWCSRTMNLVRWSRFIEFRMCVRANVATECCLSPTQILQTIRGPFASTKIHPPKEEPFFFILSSSYSRHPLVHVFSIIFIFPNHPSSFFYVFHTSLIFNVRYT